MDSSELESGTREREREKERERERRKERYYIAVYVCIWTTRTKLAIWVQCRQQS